MAVYRKIQRTRRHRFCHEYALQQGTFAKNKDGSTRVKPGSLTQLSIKEILSLDVLTMVQFL